ncbi:hypothetical protein AAF712_001839 [Marasmius tenuissimus]|uniref:Uncharacterized protein n=1 Tax=Marasmius tenuissimus TaxID=585030 RepID=A0ABR3ACG8_9AGAR
MPTTRRQATLKEQGKGTSGTSVPANKATKSRSSQSPTKPPAKRSKTRDETQEPPKKKPKSSAKNTDLEADNPEEQHFTPVTGTTERGHIYFFYRLKVQHEHAESLDDVKNFHMLLVPRPPSYTTPGDAKSENGVKAEDDMRLLPAGADAVPAPATTTQSKKFRLITVGKKKLPEAGSGGAGKGRKPETFWATVVKVGNDQDSLEKGLGEKTYETKTRGTPVLCSDIQTQMLTCVKGTRHEEPARLVGRGGYAIVNNDPSVPSKRETHLGYHISHPAEIEDSSVQSTLGVHKASSFILQVRNPLAPASGPGQPGKGGAKYPETIMKDVFGKGGKRGRESYGLRFASCETPELLDYEGAQLLLVAARGGEEGLEASLGDGRGDALKEDQQDDASESVNQVFRELGLDKEDFPDDAIVSGEWI